MARPPQWYPLLAGAIATLERSQAPVVDRRFFERELQLSARGALGFMKRLGAVQAEAGRTWFIEREVALPALRRIQDSPEAAARAQVTRRLKEMVASERIKKGRAVVLQTSTQITTSYMLPDGCQIVNGRELLVAFDDGLDLARKLYAISRWAAQDWDSFVGVFGAPKQVPAGDLRV